MKTVSNIFLTLLLMAFTFVGCESELELDFAGGDNYITSFKLTTADNEYVAAIVDDKIALTLYEGTSLTDATALYQISENAIISPAPDSITDWSVDQEFVVTSYNNMERSYQFSIDWISTSGVYTSSVELYTQEDVDAFAESDIFEIQGHLIIGSDSELSEGSPITDLSALSSVITVKGNLVIGASFAGENLNGLQNLESVSNIYFGSYDSSVAYAQPFDVHFENLTSVGEIMVNSSTITSLSLPVAESLLALTINSSSVVAVDMPSLNMIAGALSLSDLIATEVSFPALSKVNGEVTLYGLDSVVLIDFSALESVGGGINMQSMALIESIEMDNLKLVGGDLYFKTLAALTNISFAELQSVGNLDISYLNALESVTMGEIVTGDTFTIYSTTLTALDMPNLTTLTKFYVSAANLATLNMPALATLTGTLTVTAAALENFDISSLETVSTITLAAAALPSLDISALRSCTSVTMTYAYLHTTLDFSDIEDLTSVSISGGSVLESLYLPAYLSSLTLNGNSVDTVFPTLYGIERISGTLSISYYKSVDEIKLTSVNSVGTLTFATTNTSVSTLDLGSIESIGTMTCSNYYIQDLKGANVKTFGSLTLNYNYVLESIYLPQLTAITTLLKISGYSSTHAAKNLITNLDCFSNVTNIGELQLTYWTNLTDFSGLKNAIGTLSEDTWTVSNCGYNPTYEDIVAGYYTEDLLPAVSVD